MPLGRLEARDSLRRMGAIMSAAREYGLDDQHESAAPDNRPEPDVLVVPVAADTGPQQTWFKPEDVLLAVEVVSQDSVARDRQVKPRKYAEAGVPHFWRVEQDGGMPVVYVYELDQATKSYGQSGICRDELKVGLPFPIVIDLTAVGRRR
ncbi:Uma2 family endonuclease [Streptomyces violascens]|uniref:Uma2 family endonuclease n=1 Tax=Streptomyces violascens TaxID=67381 RepID=UPI0036493FC3